MRSVYRNTLLAYRDSPANNAQAQGAKSLQ